mmetsp:Transcript_38898/g.47398  ORF Transcript_38898/g.47398 Transcript_38898/m.47398 type:complete len:213 (+) Transcript_38898:1536-2174(+)
MEPIPKETNKLKATKVSVLLASATTRNTRRKTKLPTTTTLPKPTVAFNVKFTISSQPPAPPAINGKNTNSGATAKSCNNNTLVAASPLASSSHSFIFKTGKTNAEVDNVPANASTITSRGSCTLIILFNGKICCNNCGPPAKIDALSTPAVKLICATPKGKYLIKFCNREVLTSNPSLNNKNKMPKSPSSMSNVVLLNTSRTCGPSIAPAMR